MGSTGHSIHETFLEYSGAKEAVQADSFIRDQIRLDFDSGAPVVARLRDLRSTCCMIDVDNSIFTLAFSDILHCVMPEYPGSAPLVLRVRVGCLARDANALLARNTRRSQRQARSWSNPAARPARLAIPLNPPAQGTGHSGGPAGRNADNAQHAAGSRGRKRRETAQQGSSQREEQRQSLEDIERMLSEVW
jgi:hypothetical protein